MKFERSEKIGDATMVKEHAVTERPPADPVAREAWLQEGLTPEQAAAFLPTTELWLQRKRTNPGKRPGPKYSRLSQKQIVYIRRDLIEYREASMYTSTSEYDRDDAGQDEDEEGSP
jgi:hypothetical protein